MRHKIREQGEPSLTSGLGHSEGARWCHLRHSEAHGVTITVSKATAPALPLSTAFSLRKSVQFPVGTISPFPEAEKQIPPFLDVTCSMLCFPLLQMMKLEQRDSETTWPPFDSWHGTCQDMSGCILQGPAAFEAHTPSCPHQPLASILPQPHPGRSKALAHDKHRLVITAQQRKFLLFAAVTLEKLGSDLFVVPVLFMMVHVSPQIYKQGAEYVGGSWSKPLFPATQGDDFLPFQHSPCPHTTSEAMTARRATGLLPLPSSGRCPLYQHHQSTVSFILTQLDPMVPVLAPSPDSPQEQAVLKVLRTIRGPRRCYKDQNNWKLQWPLPLTAGMKMSNCRGLLLMNSAKEQFLSIHQRGDKYKQILWLCMFTFHFKMM